MWLSGRVLAQVCEVLGLILTVKEERKRGDGRSKRRKKKENPQPSLAAQPKNQTKP
jgi:hypothetical protein